MAVAEEGAVHVVGVRVDMDLGGPGGTVMRIVRGGVVGGRSDRVAEGRW